MKPHQRTPGHILEDVLAPDLSLWFVGTAAGPHSAAVGAYYAKPGNRFWPTLHAIGITPRRFAPHEYTALLELGVGLTDLCKTEWGVDSNIPPAAFDTQGFSAKVKRYRPRALAFTSKTAAALFLGVSTGSLASGQQPKREALPEIFVLPSPSGLATKWWQPQPWTDLGEWFAQVCTKT
jgi:TDG/mug DNA glycosylase family protein